MVHAFTSKQQRQFRTISVMPVALGSGDRPTAFICTHAPEEGLRISVRRWIKRRMRFSAPAATKASPAKSVRILSQPKRKPSRPLARTNRSRQDFIKTVSREVGRNRRVKTMPLKANNRSASQGGRKTYQVNLGVLRSLANCRCWRRGLAMEA